MLQMPQCFPWMSVISSSWNHFFILSTNLLFSTSWNNIPHQIESFTLLLLWQLWIWIREYVVRKVCSRRNVSRHTFNSTDNILQAELKRLIPAQLQIYKTKTMRKDNPHYFQREEEEEITIRLTDASQLQLANTYSLSDILIVINPYVYPTRMYSSADAVPPACWHNCKSTRQRLLCKDNPHVCPKKRRKKTDTRTLSVMYRQTPHPNVYARTISDILTLDSGVTNIKIPVRILAMVNSERTRADFCITFSYNTFEKASSGILFEN